MLALDRELGAAAWRATARVSLSRFELFVGNRTRVKTTVRRYAWMHEKPRRIIVPAHAKPDDDDDGVVHASRYHHRMRFDEISRLGLIRSW